MTNREAYADVIDAHVRLKVARTRWRYKCLRLTTVEWDDVMPIYVPVRDCVSQMAGKRLEACIRRQVWYTRGGPLA